MEGMKEKKQSTFNFASLAGMVFERDMLLLPMILIPIF